MKNASDYNAGPYYSAEEARAAARHGILDPAMAASDKYVDSRGQTILDLTMVRADLGDEGDYETRVMREIARTLTVEQVQVISGWITRAYYAGQLRLMTEPEGGPAA